ncbi:hypothetical protein [Flexivirga alba]|uniref:DUF222 domain-containing protein n=1 Tax=Flexivirga alba TaxID=702742 RepID=A0ABW2AJ64_9MICO
MTTHPARKASTTAHLWTTSVDAALRPQDDDGSRAGADDRSYLESEDSSDLEPGEGDSVMAREEQCTKLAAALARCPDLRGQTCESEALWLAMRAAICTRTRCHIVPLGASAPVEVTEEYASQELAEAMVWLRKNESEARCLPPVTLFRLLRAAATKGARGSARMAQQDSLHGVTGVVPGEPVAFVAYESDAYFGVEAS